jgi:RNA-directed DNA polymerase
MKLKTIHINYIKDSFGEMKSKEDLLSLLNYAKNILFGDNTKPFEIKQLNYYSNSNINKNRYTTFEILKKSGTERTIHAPKKGLKTIQKCINLILQAIYEPHNAATGFVPNKSIVDNAKIHVGSNYVYNIDLKDFFPSIDQARVWAMLQQKPFELNKKNERLILSNIIAALTCTEMEVERLNENGAWEIVKRNVLPQGAPTSPTITNIICQRLDIRLSGVAKRFGLKYSRYADDITFSSMHNVYANKNGVTEKIFDNNTTFTNEVERIINEQNFAIKSSKTRLQKRGYRQEVTGIIVNEKANVQQKYVKELRMWLYLWEKYGKEKANAYFEEKYIKDKGHTKKLPPEMQNVLAGKLEYLAMVKGRENLTYKKLKQRYEKLNENNNFINKILDAWEKEGIEKGMEIYYQSKNENKISSEVISNILKDKKIIEVIIVSKKRSKSIENCLFVGFILEQTNNVSTIAVAYDKHIGLKTGKAFLTLLEFDGVNKFNPDKPNVSATFKNINAKSATKENDNSNIDTMKDLKRFKLTDNSLKSYIFNEDIKEILIENNIVKLINADKVLKLQLHVAKNRIRKLPQTFNLSDENEIIKWIIFHHPTNKKTYLAYIDDIEMASI